MHCQKFFLTRFMTTWCFIFVFFLNCVMTAQAGKILGTVCFDNPDKDENLKPKLISSIYVKSLSKEEDSLIIENINVLYCTLTNNHENKITVQLRAAPSHLPNCYNYNVFTAEGDYKLECSKWKACLHSSFWSSRQDINFPVGSENCEPQ